MTDTLRVLAERPADDLVKLLVDENEDDPYFKLTGGVEEWLKKNWALRERAATALTEAAARILALEGALKQIIGVVSYPVATEISKRGWNERNIDTSGSEYISEIAHTALAASQERK